MQEQDTPRTATPHAAKDFLSHILRGDAWIWGIYIFLVCLSAVEIFSATSQLTYKSAYVSDPAVSHIKNLVIGVVVLLFCQSRSFKAIRAIGLVLLFSGVLLAVITPFFGVEQKGAARSIAGIQPVEVIKLGIIVVLCMLVSAQDTFYRAYSLFRGNTQLRRYILYLVLIVVAALPIATQNLSSGLIIGMASMGILFVGRVYGKYLWLTIGALAVIGGLFLGSLKVVHETHKNISGLQNIDNTESFTLDKVVDRAITWSNRIFDESDKELWEESTQGKKSQELCAHMALVNGMPLGRFIGNSKMRDFLPEAFSDYIFAIIFEEFGPLGALAVLLAYLMLFGRCFYLSRHTDDPCIRLLMIGLPLIIVIQALMHIGVNTGAMFVTGQPLPLLSRGGSSIISTSVSFGFILALSRIVKLEWQERNEVKTVSEPAPVVPLYNTTNS